MFGKNYHADPQDAAHAKPERQRDQRAVEILADEEADGRGAEHGDEALDRGGGAGDVA